MPKNKIREVRIKQPSSMDVAQLAGVSRATVSAYINGTRYVSPGLSERISRAIKELDYTPNPLARALKMKDARTIGLILPVLSRFFTPIMQAVNEIALQNGYGFLLCASEESGAREKEALEVFVSKRISGILIVPTSSENKGLIETLKDSGTPIVQINRKIAGLAVDSVISDNFKAVYTATEHLVQKKKKKIVLLGYDPDTLSSGEKKSGYDAALKKHGISDNHTLYVKDHDVQNISAVFSDFLDQNRDVDGLICATPGKTAIALKILRARNIAIPGDISVIGFDDSPWSTLIDPPLTVLSENTWRMGETAVRLLLNRISKAETGPPNEIVLEDAFLIREST